MAEHMIRLRGGWELVEPRKTDASRRITLPASDLFETPARVVLSRSFQRPRLDPLRETLWLRLEAVPGLTSIALNGREVGRGPFEDPVILLAVEDLEPRNLLVIEVEPPGAEEEMDWGSIALMVRQSE